MRQFSWPCHLNNAQMSGSQRGSQPDPQWQEELAVTSAFATTTRFESLPWVFHFRVYVCAGPGTEHGWHVAESIRILPSCLGRVLRDVRHVCKLLHIIITVLSAEC